MNLGEIALQEVPECSKESPGGPWKFIGLMPLFDPPRHDSAETIRRALNLGVNVKMITGEYISADAFWVYFFLELNFYMRCVKENNILGHPIR